MITEIVVSALVFAILLIYVILAAPFTECKHCKGAGVTYNGCCPHCVGQGKVSILSQVL